MLRAVEIIEDTSMMPTFVQKLAESEAEGTEWHAQGFDDIASMMVFANTDESVDHLCEAVKLLDRRRTGEQIATVGNFFNLAFDVLARIDCMM
eukprot:3240865-Pyramimonas_sp.AAC.1